MRSWLDDLGASGTEVDDLVLACSEACANSVENAADLPGPNALIVRGRVLAGSIVSLRVRDYGRWRFAPWARGSSGNARRASPAAPSRLARSLAPRTLKSTTR